MTENKLHIKLLSLRGIASRLPGLTLTVLPFPEAQDRSLLDASTDLLFAENTKQETEIQEATGNDFGLKAFSLSFQESLKGLSEKLAGVLSKDRSAKTFLTTSTTGGSSISNFQENSSENSITFSESTGSVTSIQSKFLSGFSKFSLAGSTENNVQHQNLYTNQVQNLLTLKSNSSQEKSNYSYEQTNTGQYLQHVSELFRHTSTSKERLLENDSPARIHSAQKPVAEKPSFTVHQTFGDIVVHPANMDVSMQQLKVKIQDILKQARDSIY